MMIVRLFALAGMNRTFIKIAEQVREPLCQ